MENLRCQKRQFGKRGNIRPTVRNFSDQKKIPIEANTKATNDKDLASV